MERTMRCVGMIMASLVLVVGVAVASGEQEAQGAGDYPSRPIQLVVPANPGGGTDLGARLLSKYLTPVVDSEVVVTNMAGAGGTIAQDFVLAAEPDGYTVLYFHEAFVGNRVFGLTNTTLEDDFATVGGAYLVDTVVVISKDFESWEGVVSAAEDREVLLGTEVGTSFHILFEAIKDRSGLDNLRFVDTGAVTPTLAALEGEQIDLMITPLGVVSDSVDSGHLNVLATVSGTERSEFIPNVPTMAEVGVDVYLPKFYFMAMPPETPSERAQLLRDAVGEVVQDEAFQQEARGLNYKPIFLQPEDIYSLEEAAFEVLDTYGADIRG